MTSAKTGESRSFICPHCEQPALGFIRGTAYTGIYDRRGDIRGPEAEYALLQCNTCDEITLRIRQDTGGGFDEDTPAVIYPAQKILSTGIPNSLRREFAEAEKCFTAKAYAATVVMVRRILEGICKEHNIDERTLAQSLEKLKEAQLIDTTIAEWANELRVLGNEGAHYTGNSVPREDAEDALEFAEALLDHVYVLRLRFQKFINRRASANKPIIRPAYQASSGQGGTELRSTSASGRNFLITFTRRHETSRIILNLYQRQSSAAGATTLQFEGINL